MSNVEAPTSNQIEESKKLEVSDKMVFKDADELLEKLVDAVNNKTVKAEMVVRLVWRLNYSDRLTTEERVKCLMGLSQFDHLLVDEKGEKISMSRICAEELPHWNKIPRKARL